MSTDIQKNSALAQSVQKLDFWDLFGKVLEGWYLQTMSKFLSIQYPLKSIKSRA